MKLSDLIARLKYANDIGLRVDLYRGSIDNPICITKLSWEGLLPYLDEDVIGIIINNDRSDFVIELHIVLDQNDENMNCTVGE